MHVSFLLQRPVPLTEIKVSPPKFDLAATNFPPLPGCVVSTQGEPVLENRMSDVVRGLYRDKVRRSTRLGGFEENLHVSLWLLECNSMSPCLFFSVPPTLSLARLNKPIK